MADLTRLAYEAMARSLTEISGEVIFEQDLRTKVRTGDTVTPPDICINGKPMLRPTEWYVEDRGYTSWLVITGVELVDKPKPKINRIRKKRT